MRIAGLLLVMLLPLYSQAQCAMCRAVLESNDDTGIAEGINDGIVYLMAIPYVVVGVLIFVVYRKMRA
ncbi:hypothetical protein SAMN04490243_0612 [Robiginitalea myxolifaciens]|uniref:Uncharacterized protein n=2 Tax=Robiginitalea myxolifaciens TaxID=400055 RepID=A0A1I6FT47_9FLAO|nr:hypothetical protein [Robiginitalea myxolifaciens]SFR33101.1 hypothetical protein SAMN04490243_0612 [Robiginitalea myxolifaciens]